MLTLLKRMFRRSAAPAPLTEPAPMTVPHGPTPPADGTAQPGSSAPARPQVAVAQLSLAAIIDRFPADLRENVAKAPPATVTVALPLATIHKQLPGGSVKMSLASLYRQAPAGTFIQARAEDRRMVEVPLAEIFRHLDPQALRRRSDQRRVDLPKGAPGLFGDRANPFVVTPMAEEPEPEPDPEPVPDETSATVPDVHAFRLDPPAARPETPAEPAAPAAEGPFFLPLAELCGAWPEPYRSEAESMGSAVVNLAQAGLAACLARGRVSFAWGQLRAWIQPAPAMETAGAEMTELVLPLKVVAPAWFAHARPSARRRSVEVDESIPALFGGGAAALPAVAPASPVPEPPAPAEAPGLRLAPPVELAPFVPAAPALAAPEPAPAPATIGELFGAPGQAHWSAQEIIEKTARLSGIAGAVLALQEGLLVSAHLPEEIKGDTVAAFLPQIFARLSHYTGEMKLGAVDDVLLSMQGAHLQAWRIGEVYFAVLGHPGAGLPWDALHLVVEELKKQAPQ